MVTHVGQSPAWVSPKLRPGPEPGQANRYVRRKRPDSTPSLPDTRSGTCPPFIRCAGTQADPRQLSAEQTRVVVWVVGASTRDLWLWRPVQTLVGVNWRQQLGSNRHFRVN